MTAIKGGSTLDGAALAELEGGFRPEIVGRDQELRSLPRFVGGETAERLLVIRGEPGTGKTTLWEVGRTAAAARGVRVLQARGAEAETELPFAVLSDLLEGVGGDADAQLPAPQRRALDVALLRVESGEAPPQARAIALGVLNTLRSLAADGPVLLAIDDVHWADVASMKALAFAVRRLEGDRVRLLLARREGRATALESAVPSGEVTDLVLRGLSLGAVRRLLAVRLELTLSRRVLRQVFEATLGNPLFALELGRALVERGAPAIGEELVLPDSLDELLGARTSASEEIRRALLGVALDGGLSSAELAGVVGEGAVEAAAEDGLLVVDRARVRPSHPLFAAAVVKRSAGSERREMHRALANVVTDAVRRALHLAHAQARPDAALAALVAAGAASGIARGATEQAVELAEHALRLTPDGAPERSQRVLVLGEYLAWTEESQRLKELLLDELDALPPGGERAQGHLLLSRVPASQEEYDHHLERAIAESALAPRIRARALAEQSLDATSSWLERLDEAEARALEAWRLASSGPGSDQALQALAWVRILRGRPISDLRTHEDAREECADVFSSLERIDGIRLAFRGEVAAARGVFRGEMARAEERGQREALAALQHQLCELELRAGQVGTAARLADERDPTEGQVRAGLRSHGARLRAVAAAVRGDPVAAERWAAQTLALVVGQRWDVLEASRARGIAALAARDPARAVELLMPVWQHTESEGIDDPGVFPVAPDLVEASLELGHLPQAQAVLARLAALAEQQDHPWGLASAQRCRGLLRLAEGGNFDEARTDLQGAAEAYRCLGLGFDGARTLLALGRVARRMRKWSAARDALEGAVRGFTELGCDEWGEQARQDLDRVGGRRPRGEAELTPTELRVARHAADGRSNKEIAQALVVTVHTVEVHLSHAYAKLGVRSRGQLAQALTASARTPDA